VQRPIIATVDFAGPFQVLTRPFTLKPRNRQSRAPDPVARVESVHLTSSDDETGLARLIGKSGLSDRDHDGLLEHDMLPTHMWLGAWTTNLCIEFELSEAVPLTAIEVWNFNAAWETAKGLSKADVAVSSDGTTWQTVLRGAEFAEAEGTADYDEPTVLRLNGVLARKVRFENTVPLSTSGKVGLSKVRFHRAAGSQTESSPQSKGE